MYPKLPGIYKIESFTHPERAYIGSSVNIIRREKEHSKRLFGNYHPNAKLQAHFNKYGATDLLFSIIEICDVNILIEREQHYIDTLHPSFNLRQLANSNIGYVPSPETIKKLRLSHLGQHPTQEAIEKNRKANSGKNNAFFGKKHKPESIQKMVAGHKKYYKTHDGPFKGKKHKQESIELMISKVKGRHHSPHTEFKKGHVFSPDILEQRAIPLRKPIVQLTEDFNLIRRWASISEAVKAGYSHAPISLCCNGKQLRHRGFIWLFEKEYINTVHHIKPS